MSKKELKNETAENKFSEREKAKKKSLKANLIAGGVVGAIFGLIFGIICATESFWLIFIVPIPFVLFGLGLGFALAYSDIKRIKRSFCPSCGEQYNYDSDIAWEISSEEEKTNNAVVANVEVACTCHKCGEQVDFSVRQTTQSQDPRTGRIKKYNIENSMKKYFFSPKTKKSFLNIF